MSDFSPPDRLGARESPVSQVFPRVVTVADPSSSVSVRDQDAILFRTALPCSEWHSGNPASVSIGQDAETHTDTS